MYNLTNQQLRTQIINELALRQDPKKLVSFLAKVTITKQEDSNIYISSPNQFVLVQVQKFFGADLDNICQSLNLKYTLNIDESLKDAKNPILIDLNQILAEKLSADNAIKAKLESNLPAENKSDNISSSINNQQSNHITNYGMTKMLSNYFGIMFDAKYTFDNFIVGSGNEFAYNIATAISKNPGTNYNPFFIRGNVGLGKTHLLQATANSIITRFPDKTVLYLPTTKFIDEMVDSIRKNKLNSFIKKFDGVDVLMLDDIQFLANKEKTQEILHNLFNEFVSRNKQIIISSDRPPKQLATIEDRLRSRFGQGMICDISLPDVETRTAIITNYLQYRNIHISTNLSTNQEAINIIANAMNDNIREIEGLLNSLIAKKEIINRDLTLSDIYMAIKNLGYIVNMSNDLEKMDNLTGIYGEQISTGEKSPEQSLENHQISNYNKFDRIVEQYCHNNHVDINELKSDSKKRHVSQLRQELMYIAKNDLGWTFARIAEYFGGKHHTAVMYAVDQHSARIRKTSQES